MLERSGKTEPDVVVAEVGREVAADGRAEAVGTARHPHVRDAHIGSAIDANGDAWLSDSAATPLGSSKSGALREIKNQESGTREPLSVRSCAASASASAGRAASSPIGAGPSFGSTELLKTPCSE